MLSPLRMLDDVIASLRNVIAPAISDPYPKTQAYMAAVVLEFLSKSLEARRDMAAERDAAVHSLFDDLREICADLSPAEQSPKSGERRVAELIEALEADRERLGDAAYAAAKRRVRQTLRQFLDQELRIVGGKD